MPTSACRVDDEFDARARSVIEKLLIKHNVKHAEPVFVPAVCQSPLKAHSPYAIAADSCLTYGHHYVEGFLFPAGRLSPVPHAWSVNSSGGHVDTSRFGQADVYYAVQVVSPEEFAAHMEYRFDAFARETSLPYLTVSAGAS